MWRPEGWKNPNKEYEMGYGGCGETFWYESIRFKDYEAGADAMLGMIITLIKRLGYGRVVDNMKIYMGVLDET